MENLKIVSTNIQFYFNCRSRIENDLNTIYDEIKSLFEVDQDWSHFNLKLTEKNIQFDPETTNCFKNAKLAGSNPKEAKLFYFLCRLQFGLNEIEINNEVKHIFGCDLNDEKQEMIGDSKCHIITQIKQLNEFLKIRNMSLQETVTMLQNTIDEINKDYEALKVSQSDFLLETEQNKKRYDALFRENQLLANKLERYNNIRAENEDTFVKQEPEAKPLPSIQPGSSSELLTNYFQNLQKQHNDQIKELQSSIATLISQSFQRDQQNKEYIQNLEFNHELTQNALKKLESKSKTEIQNLTEERDSLLDRLEQFALLNVNQEENEIKIKHQNKIIDNLECELNEQKVLYKNQSESKSFLEEDMVQMTQKIESMQAQINQLNDTIKTSLLADLVSSSQLKSQIEKLNNENKDLKQKYDRIREKLDDLSRQFSFRIKLDKSWADTANKIIANHNSSIDEEHISKKQKTSN